MKLQLTSLLQLQRAGQSRFHLLRASPPEDQYVQIADVLSLYSADCRSYLRSAVGLTAHSVDWVLLGTSFRSGVSRHASSWTLSMVMQYGGCKLLASVASRSVSSVIKKIRLGLRKLQVVTGQGCCRTLRINATASALTFFFTPVRPV